ncbi:MAG TPA: TetR/AcrR family transcriptional regulator C-terminal domain-containing protein [Actinomycetota bacterium]|nr:TetR/AcrR family transcriptional regulator C-terminal domain-containing protein [Actinomycetota bacterium]
MSMTAQSQRPVRAPLSRQRVLRAALDYVDQHGLEALSMHKLGAELGVKAMSLYKHVTDKDDILDGIVELLWDELPAEPPAGDWREAIRQLAAALRDLVHRHPHAATLLYSRQELREHPLRIAHGVLRRMREGGVPEHCAVALLRTVFPYGIGYALAELSLPPPPPPGPDSQIALIRQVSGMLSPQASDELVRTALLVCGDCDMTAQFRTGVDLMIHGLDAYLATLQEDAAAATP